MSRVNFLIYYMENLRFREKERLTMDDISVNYRPIRNVLRQRSSCLGIVRAHSLCTTLPHCSSQTPLL